MKSYTYDMKHKGFTVVELLVVIVVVVILAAITIASYSFVRDDAMDTKIKSAVKTVGDAIQLHEAQNTTRITGQGYFSNANSVDTLKPNYLKPDYRDGLSSKNASSSVTVMRYYHCPNITSGFIIYASLSNPSSSDIDTFNTLRSSCGHNASQAPTSGDPIYNYAQVF